MSLKKFLQKIRDFSDEVRGSAPLARIHEIGTDASQSGRLGRILSDSLMASWSSLNDGELYVVDVGISCNGTWQIRPKPKRGRRTQQKWAEIEAEWARDRNDAYDRWDLLKDERYSAASDIISFHGGEILQNVEDYDPEVLILPDSFTLRLKISGKGLRDFALNYPFIFEVVEPDDIELPQRVRAIEQDAVEQTEILAPAADAPTVCVIDSGIQEEHRWIQPAIHKATSYCFVPGLSATDVADLVPNGGHGTRVAGAVLHGEVVPRSGSIRLTHWIQNARVLDGQGALPQEVLPPLQMRRVIEHFHHGEKRTRIFNHSINGDTPCRTKHMSAWAAEVDRVSFSEDVLLIQSAGNLALSSPPPKHGIEQLLGSGHQYPGYLAQPISRIANPAQSFQALTVGSVAYGLYQDTGWKSFASIQGQPSSFSRTGLGIWGAIKPEVVEFGGDCLVSHGTNISVATPDVAKACYPELVRATLGGGPAFARDTIGTSFATPKVTRIAAMLQALFPEESCLLYRALIAQSARWPDWASQLSSTMQAALLKQIGYGIPDVGRATENTDHRTTLISHGEHQIGAGSCHVFQVPIPAVLRNPSEDYMVRIDVTLSYVAEPRRTRRTTRGYLSTWLDWMTNRKGEVLENFLTRAFKDEEEPADHEGSASIPWVIRHQSHYGLPNVRRSIGTLQKDWAVMPCNALPHDLCIAVRGHKGWSKDPEAAARYVLCVTFDVVGQEMPVYIPLREAVRELQLELEQEIEADEEEEESDEVEV